MVSLGSCCMRGTHLTGTLLLGPCPSTLVTHGNHLVVETYLFSAEDYFGSIITPP